ncbi:hypothetical protein BWQ93_05920 [Sphingopyxis sp. QXT-31]|uniref:hypothetical protein n=1 Tax=Sphingopyxis sp. QXT-31 TaxID=1357916 RepID=UPI000979649B|nr:hypothetical protein [Sphingopyxis sp. QXT-31]APZ98067.1 hypothetical protein BWQ93_05920 [Sphingopyxis sp. QXT-31]
MTTGVDIVGALLLADTGLLARVPVDSIKAAKLPDGITLPALLVRLVSQVSRQTLTRQAKTRRIDRVSVTVRAASYEEQTEIIALVQNCCAGVTAAGIAGGERVAVLDAGQGPDLLGPGDSFEQAQDFRVSYDA